MSRILSGLCLALALVVSAPLTASAVTFGEGVTFNDPLGTHAEQFAIHHKLRTAIANTPAGQTIRIASWRYADPVTTRMLLQAYRRGVHVRVILNRHLPTNGSFETLRQTVGSDVTAGSYAVECRRGCRSSVPAAMHAKYYTFTRTGDTRQVVMVSSTNVTRTGALRGFNDMYTVVERPALFNTFTDVFEQMKYDEPVEDSFRTVSSGRYRASFYPRPGTTRASDDTYEALTRVSCEGALGGTGEHGRTAIRVSMWHWAGDRGEYLARKLLSLDDAGCAVHVTYGAPSRQVVRILRTPTANDGIDLHDSRVDSDFDGRKDHYVHTKYMAIGGVFEEDPSAQVVFTGSQNWTTASLRGSDEDMLRISGAEPYGTYVREFAQVRRTLGRDVDPRGVGPA